MPPRTHPDVPPHLPDARSDRRRTRGARRLLPVVGALALVVLSALPASAHVRVEADGATQGGFSEIGFRVPTESETASTTKVAIFFPTDTPLAFVSVKPHPGWSYQVTRATLDTPIEAFGETITEAVSRIVWTSDSADTAVKPGEYDVFDVFAGPLPEADSITFKAVQTYSDGDVVRWIEPTPASGEEPEHPAPTLALAAADDTEGASPSADASAAAASVEASPVDATTDDDGGSTLPVVLSIVALLVALGAGALALTGRRRTTS